MKARATRTRGPQPRPVVGRRVKLSNLYNYALCDVGAEALPELAPHEVTSVLADRPLTKREAANHLWLMSTLARVAMVRLPAEQQQEVRAWLEATWIDIELEAREDELREGVA